MDWTAATGWWIAAGMLVAIELLTGTFYLLMLALGCVAAALAAQRDRWWGRRGESWANGCRSPADPGTCKREPTS